MVLARPDERETWPYHCSLRLFTMVRGSSCGPTACWILARTSLSVTWSFMRCVVYCTSFSWLVFFFGALLWEHMIHKHTGKWMWQGSASVVSLNWYKSPVIPNWFQPAIGSEPRLGQKENVYVVVGNKGRDSVGFSGFPTDRALNNSTFSPRALDSELDRTRTRIRWSWLPVDELKHRSGRESSFLWDINTGMVLPRCLRWPALQGRLFLFFDRHGRLLCMPSCRSVSHTSEDTSVGRSFAESSKSRPVLTGAGGAGWETPISWDACCAARAWLT